MPNDAIHLQKAHRVAKLFCGTKNLDSYCLEASVVMVEYLRRHQIQAQLIRREYNGDGHWTIKIDQIEYDPTCADWKTPPAGSIAGQLYTVTNHSTHSAWPQTKVNETIAYECVGIRRREYTSVHK